MAEFQLDMFGQPVPFEGTRQAKPKSPGKSDAAGAVAPDLEAMARSLEASGLYRISRKLSTPSISIDVRPGFPRIGLLVDTETTGLSHKTSEVIEIGAVAFTYADDGTIGDVIGVYGGLRQPTVPIPANITKLTGITDEMVAGQSIDQRELDLLVGPADLVIAHNAAFDRPFCEMLSQGFVSKAWACSVADVDWSARGFEGSKLGYLIGQAGYFHDGHRAVDDCFALLEILSKPGSNGLTPFAELLHTALHPRARIFAENSPFDMKDKLKARGYRWSDGADGRPKAWWVEVNEDKVDDEQTYLRTQVYGRADAEPLVTFLTAANRFKG